MDLASPSILLFYALVFGLIITSLQGCRIRVNIYWSFKSKENQCIVIGSTYCHPHLGFDKFNDYYLNIYLKENKNGFLLGDFDIDFLKSD